MNNFSIAQDATAMALDSTNSSMIEQEKFANSLQGRLNRLDTAWNKLTLSAGSAVMTDGLISVVETLNDLATGMSFVVDKVGLLSIVFGTLGATTVLLSTRFRTFTTALLFGTTGMTRAQLVTSGLTASMGRLGIATVGAKIALRGLAAASVVGVAFVALGFAIEKLIGLYSNAKQKQEEFEQSQQDNIKALTVNKDHTEQLIDSYKKLSTAKESGTWDTEKEKEYLKVQQQLGDTFPNLIESMDATGQYRLKSIEGIDREIQATRDLINLKKEEVKLSALKTFEDNIDERDGLFGLEQKIERKRKELNDVIEYGSFKPTFVNKLKQELLQLENEFARTSAKVNDEVLKVAEAYNQFDIDPTIKKNIQDFLYSLDLTKLDSSELESYAISISMFTDEMQKAYESGNEKAFEKARQSIVDYAKQMGATDFQVKALDVTLGKVVETNERLANATYAGADGMGALEDVMLGVEVAGDALVKVYDDAISNVESLNGIINDLNENHQVSAKTISTIMDKYPDLLSYLDDEAQLRQEVMKKIDDESGKALDSITQKLYNNEQYFKKVTDGNNQMVSALSKAYNVDLNNVKTLAQFKLAVEQGLMKQLANGWADYYNAQTMTFTEAGRKMMETMSYAKAVNSPELKAIAEYELAMKGLTESLRNSTSSFTSTNIQTTGLSDSTSKLGKEYESATYLTDKFKSALEKLNLELEKQRAIQAKFPEHSKEYRSALEAEMKLLKDKKQILEDQAKALQSQIKSGKIQKTGVITTTSPSSSSDSTVSDYYLNNSSFRQSSQYGEVSSIRNGRTHAGLDLDASAGTDIKSLRDGKVTQVYFNKSTGHAVAIQQDDGTVAKYYHMQSKSPLKVGQSVSAGQSVGKVGSTGNSTGNHLHLQVEKGGKTINPLDYLKNLKGATGEASKAMAENMADVDSASSDLLQLTSDIMAVQAEINAIEQDRLIQSKISEYEHLISGVERTLEKINTQMSLQEEGSEKYNNLLKQQVAHHKYKQSLLHKEAEYLRGQINSGKLNARQVDEIKQKVSELSLAWWDVENSIHSVNQKLMDMREQIADDVIDAMKDSLSQQRDMESAQYDKKLKDLQDTYDATMEAYDKDLEAFEEAHNNKMDIIDEEMKKAEEAYKEKVKLLEKEAKVYEETINNRLKSMRRLRDEENYDDEVGDRQKEINKLQSKIDVLSLDNSYKAQSEKAKLEEELAKLKEELSDYQSDREYELREQNLQDQLEAYQKEIEAQKESMDQKYESYQKDMELQKEALENKLESYKKDIEAKKKAEEANFKSTQKRIQDEKAANERALNEQIANERKWASLREEIVAGNLDNVKGLIGGYLEELQKMNKDIAEQIGISWEGVLNTIDRITNASNSLSNLPLTIQQTIDKMQTNSNAWQKASKDEQKELAQDNQNLGNSIGATYNPSTGEWTYGGEPLFNNGSSSSNNNQSVISQMKANSDVWHNASASEKKRLEEENKRLGQSIGATYDSAKGKWLKNGASIYHEGGIVGDKPTNRLAELANKLFNAKPNEQIIKSLKGELQVPPKNIPNIFNTIGNLMNSIKPQVLTTDSGVTINQMDVHIGNIEGGEAGAKSLFKHIDRQMVRRGR